MKQIMVYEAKDGTHFNTADECKAYERKLKEKEEKLYVYYKDKNNYYGKFDVTCMNGNDELFLETRTEYIYVPNSRVADVMNYMRFCAGVDFCGDVLYKYDGLYLKPYIQYLNATIRNYTNDLRTFENFSSMADYYDAYFR